MRTVIWCGLILLLTSVVGNAASFDCKKATTDVEKTICEYSDLSLLDEELGALYKDGMRRAENAEHRNRLRSWQLAWLKYRDEGCGAVATCLRNVYASRIAIFGQLFEEAKQPPLKPKKGEKFVLEKGHDNPLCEEYTRFVTSVVVDQPVERLMCSRIIPPHFQSISQPEWREIDPRDYMDLAIAVRDRMRVPWINDLPPNQYLTQAHIEGTRESILSSSHKYHHDKWYFAKADVDNDGRPEQLVKYRRGRCNNAWPDNSRYAIPIMVVSEDGKSVDGPKTRQLMRLDLDEAFVANTESFDVFSFEGKVYVDHWENYRDFNGMQGDGTTLLVYLSQKKKDELVCKYWFPGNE